MRTLQDPPCVITRKGFMSAQGIGGNPPPRLQCARPQNDRGGDFLAKHTMLMVMPALWLGACVLTLSVLEVHVLGSMHQHVQPMRAFIPHWLAKSKFSSGMLHWNSDSPKGHSYSQDEEDVTALAHYFHNLYNGTFLELGALDGTMFSNTRLYEEQRGWRGVLIEPNREEFEKIPTVRPNSIAVHAAICDSTQDVHFISRRSHHQETGSAGRLSASCPRFARNFC